MPATMTNLGMNDQRTRTAMRGANAESFNPIINGRAMRAPLQMIYIFSVAKRSFDIRHPLFPRLTLKGCEDGERYVKAAMFGDPIPQASPDQERGGTRIDDNDGWITAIDMLNPGNFTLDPYAGASNPNFFANTNGTNLISEGVWPSLNEVPTEAEIRRAEEARDKHYRYLTGEAKRLANVSKKQLDEFLQRYPDTHMAMASLKLKADWTTFAEVTAECPNCGDTIKPGLAFHQSSVGFLCILDATRALAAGAITKERFEELTGGERRGPGRPRKEASAEGVAG